MLHKKPLTHAPLSFPSVFSGSPSRLNGIISLVLLSALSGVKENRLPKINRIAEASGELCMLVDYACVHISSCDLLSQHCSLTAKEVFSSKIFTYNS